MIVSIAQNSFLKAVKHAFENVKMKATFIEAKEQCCMLYILYCLNTSAFGNGAAENRVMRGCHDE